MVEIEDNVYCVETSLSIDLPIMLVDCTIMIDPLPIEGIDHDLISDLVFDILGGILVLSLVCHY